MRYLFTAAIAFTLWSLGASQKAGECVVKCNSMKLDVLTLEICRYIQGSISVRHIFIYFILIWIRPYSKHILHGLLLSREAKKTLPRPKVGDFCSVAMEQGFSDACVPLCLGNTPYTVHCKNWTKSYVPPSEEFTLDRRHGAGPRCSLIF